MMGPTGTSRLYGLTVRSQVPLWQQRPAPHGSAVDLDISLGEPTRPAASPPAGRILLDLRARQQYYTGTTADDGYHLRFYGACDVDLDPDLARAVVRPVEGVDTSLLSVITGGTLLAFVLALRGATVLHASAVQVGDLALGFTAASGMGKSTMATLMCAGGARLITDDLLRLEPGRGLPRCALGASESRLRKSASELTTRFATTPLRRRTGDARDALALPAATDEGVPLAALVVPVPHHSTSPSHASVERLAAKEALLLLSRFPRLLGWRDPEVVGRQFDQLGEVVSRVPVHLARLPWGPPFRQGLTTTVLQATGLGATTPRDTAGGVTGATTIFG